MKTFARLTAAFAASLLALTLSTARQSNAAGSTAALPTIAAKTAGMERHGGFFTFYWDAGAGKVWLEVDRWNAEFLYIRSLPAGVGSNDIGLDRGLLGPQSVVKFIRSGPRVLLLEPNYAFRASSTSATERRAVEDAFAGSVLWGFDVAAADGDRALVDATTFFLRDGVDVVGRLRDTRQGSYRLEVSRSAFYLPVMKSFPRNTEVEVMLTFVGDQPGSLLRSVVPTPEAVTVRERHSLVELPGPGYTPRAFDPRGGFFGISYMDYATPIGEPITKRFISRHRLVKRDPSLAVSDPVTPIVYYLDPGTPEPVRSALLDGARWWSGAFEGAGFRNAFRVEMLPDTADPLDIRYNVIQWVHRSTRGWSYGAGVTDPRTGEIIKGHVSLGSLRVRQDYLIAEGLLSPYETGTPVSPAMERMALARLRQLAAHEVGHTLGLAHNYIASAQGRASVMDYPHPLVGLDAAGRPDLSNAYAVGVGGWDSAAIRFGYGVPPAGTSESTFCSGVIADAARRGLSFLSDQDARPSGSAHPLVHLWDNGTDPVSELGRVMTVRSAALRRFSENAIRGGAPLATLEETLVPLYLGHRYQLEAAAKVIGGMEYTYALRGDGQTPTAPVPADWQHRALDAVLSTLTPEALRIPDRILKLIPPRPMGYDHHQELFSGRTGLTFYALAPAEAAATHAARLLFDGERAARLVEQHSFDPGLPGLDDLIDRTLAVTWLRAPVAGADAEIGRTVDDAVLEALFALAADDGTPAQVRAVVDTKLGDLAVRLKAAAGKQRDLPARAHLAYGAERIDKFRKDPKSVVRTSRTVIPPGQPIGD